MLTSSERLKLFVTCPDIAPCLGVQLKNFFLKKIPFLHFDVRKKQHVLRCMVWTLACTPYFARGFCLIQMNEESWVCFCRQNWNECCLGCIYLCVKLRKDRLKKNVFWGAWKPIYLSCRLSILATQHINPSALLSIHVDIPTFWSQVCPCAPLSACVVSTDEIASPQSPPPLPPPPNVIWLPLGPRRTHQNGEKIERFIGTPVRTPSGFMANRQCLSFSREKQSKKGLGGAAWEKKAG